MIRSVLAKAFRGELVATEAELAAKEGREVETAEQVLAHIRARPRVGVYELARPAACRRENAARVRIEHSSPIRIRIESAFSTTPRSGGSCPS
jgi:hypothetical protein